jgi:hypothetical protein
MWLWLFGLGFSRPDHPDCLLGLCKDIRTSVSYNLSALHHTILNCFTYLLLQLPTTKVPRRGLPDL